MNCRLNLQRIKGGYMDNKETKIEETKETKTEESKVRVKKVARIVGEYALIAVIVIIIFKCLLMITFVPSESMEDTIRTGDMVLCTRFDAKKINRYDIMVFKAPDEDVYYIKRVIGLPGETITVENGKVYADGVELDDSFVEGEMDNKGDGIYEVPGDCYFMMGDNRNNSYDSRFWDSHYVPIDNFVAHARFIIYPINYIGFLK